MTSNRQLQELHQAIIFDLEQLLKEEPDPEKRRKWFQQQHKTPGVDAYGISLPAVRKLIKRFVLEFRELTMEAKFDLATLLYQSGNFEQATIGDTLVELALPDLTPSSFDLINDAVGCFNNWPSVDWLCLHGFQSLLLDYRSETLDLLRRWNRSANIWKPRASVVAFVRRIGSSEDFTDEALE
jgi:3-methyladenine DNA glycosylase AlkD